MADRSPGIEATASPERSASAMPTMVIAALVMCGLYFGRDILMPFALAVLLSFLLAPAVRLLRRWRVGRVTAVLATVLLAFLAIFGFGAVVAEEVATLGQRLPEYEINIQAKIRSLHGAFPGAGLVDRASAMFRELGAELAGSDNRPQVPGVNGGLPTDTRRPVRVEIQQPEPAPVQVVRAVIGPLLQPLATAGLVIVFVVLVLLKREDLRDRLLRLAGEHDLHRTTEAMNDAAQRVSRYLLMQLVINTTYGVPVGIGLAVIGIPNAALWGMMAVLLRFIPYLGVVIAAAFPLALAIAVDPGWSLVGWTALLFVVVEPIVSNVVEPWVYGASTGVSSVAVIAAATFWTWLWGPVGLLLSTPLTVCLVVLGQHIPQLKFLHVLLGNQPVLAPEETFYQRLLANDPEEATEQAEEFARETSMAAFFDEVAIPALALAQADSDRGALPVDRRARIVEGFATILENLADDNGIEARDGGPVPGMIACIAGRNELDVAAASLLLHLLQRRGLAATVFPSDAIVSENLRSLPLQDASVVCLSLISTGSTARARYLVRRMRRRAPRARMMVGLWGQLQSSLAISEARAASSADVVIGSLRDAVAAIDAAVATSADRAPDDPSAGEIPAPGGPLEPQSPLSPLTGLSARA